MPTYDFVCPNCQISVEIVSSVSEQASPKCDCGQMMIKQFSAPGIIFKGNGWGGKP